MTSMMTIFISITAIIAIISGEALNLSPNMDLSGVRVSSDKLPDTQSVLKPIVSKNDELNLTWPLRTRIEISVQQTTPTADTGNTESMVNQHESQKEQGPALDQTRGTDGGLGSDMSLPDSIFPLNDNVNPIMTVFGVKYWMRRQLEIMMMNRIRESLLSSRYRRSAEAPNTNNTTVAPQPMDGTVPSKRYVICLVSLTNIFMLVLLPNECIQYILNPTHNYS